MKLFFAALVYVLAAAVIGWGLLLLFVGKPWLLIAAALAYLVALWRIGCTAH